MKKILSIVLTIVMCASLAGCATTTSGQATEQGASSDTVGMELKQNDYRGASVRSSVIKELVIAVVNEMKSNNEGIRAENPNSYWLSSGYQDFVTTFLNSPIANDMQWFNEEETTFEQILEQMYISPNSFTKLMDGNYVKKYEAMLVERIEKDHYRISNIQDTWINDGNKYSGDIKYHALYDCDKDWSKAYSTVDVKTEGIPLITTDLYEYARVNKDAFMIQTSTERLYVKLVPVKDDTDLRDRTIEEFYYSRLGFGQRTMFEPYTPMEEEGWETVGYSSEVAQFNRLMESYPIINLEGDLATRYGYNDSLFTNDAIYMENPSDWVFEDKALQQTLVYKNGNLVVTTFNKLSCKYEQYVFYYGDKAVQSVIAITPLVEMIEISLTPEEE